MSKRLSLRAVSPGYNSERGGRSRTGKLKRATSLYRRGNSCFFTTQRNTLIADGDPIRLTFEQLIIINLNIREVLLRRGRGASGKKFFTEILTTRVSSNLGLLRIHATTLWIT